MKVAPIAITVSLLAAIAGGGYWYWTTTPLYALQSLMMALQNHDGQAFSKRVDVQGAVENMLEDVLVYPALSTPNLSSFQKQVATGAITMAKAQIKDELLKSIYRSLSAPTQYGDGNGPTSSLLIAPAYAADNASSSNASSTSTSSSNTSSSNTSSSNTSSSNTSSSNTSSSNTSSSNTSSTNTPTKKPGDVRDLLNVASHELGGEVGKLKNEAYQRMQKYVHDHPYTIPGRVINAPPGQRGQILRRVLEDHGFSQNYFKGLTGYKLVPITTESTTTTTSGESSVLPLGEITVTTSGATPPAGAERALVGLRFYSPKISQEIIVEIEMMKGFKASNSSVEDTEWCVTRLANVRPVLDSVAQDYLTDVHELIAYSLYGMNNQNINKDMRGITDRIKSHPAAQDFLKKLGI